MVNIRATFTALTLVGSLYAVPVVCSAQSLTFHEPVIGRPTARMRLAAVRVAARRLVNSIRHRRDAATVSHIENVYTTPRASFVDTYRINKWGGLASTAHRSAMLVVQPPPAEAAPPAPVHVTVEPTAVHSRSSGTAVP